MHSILQTDVIGARQKSLADEAGSLEGDTAMTKVAAKKAATKPKLSKFKAAEYLASEVAIREFLAAAMEDANPYVFLAALVEVATARGFECSGLGRESRCKALRPEAKPRYEAVSTAD